MGKLVYAMGVSLDGFIAGRNGEIEWGAPGEELHRFHNEQTRRLSLHLCGRRLYEAMVSWETWRGRRQRAPAQDARRARDRGAQAIRA